MPSSSPSRPVIPPQHSPSTSPEVEHPRHSPTLARSVDPNDPSVQERQRSLDVDSAMQLSRARGGSIAYVSSPTGPAISPAVAASVGTTQPIAIPQPSPEETGMSMVTSPHFPFLPPGPSDFEEIDAASNIGMNLSNGDRSEGSIGMAQMSPSGQNDSMPGLPLYQPATYQSSPFNFSLMDGFAEEEKKKSLIAPRSAPPHLTALGVSFRVPPSATIPPPTSLGAPAIVPSEQAAQTGVLPEQQGIFVPADTNTETTPSPAPAAVPESSISRLRQRKLSHSTTPRPRARRQGRKMALFEGTSGAPPPSFGFSSASGSNRFGVVPSYEAATAGQDSGPSRLPAPLYSQTGHERPYRFSFWSSKLSATIHARNLSELPEEGQTFEDLFTGIHPRAEDKDDQYKGQTRSKPGENGMKPDKKDPNGNSGDVQDDEELSAWWLDVTSPTDEEMKLLSKVFSIHPLTTEDIQMEETREKIELFRNYYLVCFRSFDQDTYSPTYLEPLNMYIVVFREGTLSFHFRPTPHPENVRRRIKHLKDYINVTSDWISYALIDDITDAFGPLIQNIEYEVDSIDELVLILKEAEQSDMLRRIGTCRKKVMGLLRLMSNKADVVKGLAKRCNENWSIAPKSDIGLYLSDIQDHLITMTQNLNHYEKILSRSHSNYLAQISIEMTDANNQINDVLSKLTALGTVLIPMNLVTGLWGMNVHVPGQDIETYTWFVSIIAGLVVFAFAGGILAYKMLTPR